MLSLPMKMLVLCSCRFVTILVYQAVVELRPRVLQAHLSEVCGGQIRGTFWAHCTSL